MMRRMLALALCLLLVFGLMPGPAGAEGVTDAWGYTDEDGDGLILLPVAGKTFTGFLLIVLDPTRVAVACRPDRFYGRGYTVAEFAEDFHAAAAVNAGGFEDYDGNGDGSVPETLVVTGGEIFAGWQGVGNGFVGLDGAGWLQVGFSDSHDVTNRDIVEGVGYGPVLITDGVACDRSQSAFNYWEGTLNPRTVIAQRQDGAVLFLLAQGREPNQLGASFADCTELLLSYGAMTACNLDGGNSSQLWMNGDYLNNLPGSFRIRPIPTCYIVKEAGSGAWSTPEVPEEDRHGLTKAEREALLPSAVTGGEVPSEAEKQALADLALRFAQRYVAFSADLNGLTNPNYSAILELVVPGGELQQHLHGAFGSFGYWQVYSCTLDTFEMSFCRLLSDGRYQVGVKYTTTTVGTKGVPVTEDKNLALTIVREDEKYLVEDMTFY